MSGRRRNGKVGIALAGGGPLGGILWIAGRLIDNPAREADVSENRLISFLAALKSLRSRPTSPRSSCLRAPELNPVENVWEFLRSNWLSNLVFDTYHQIIDAACDAWRTSKPAPKESRQSACESGRISVTAHELLV